MLACLAAGCGDTGGAASTAPTPASSALNAPAATSLPREGTVRLPDKKIWTVVAPGKRLQLDDLVVVVQRVEWKQGAGSATATLGSKVHAVVTVSVRNTGSADAAVSPTQMWLYDTRNVAHLAAAGGLIGQTVPAGGVVTGRLVFPMPAKTAGGLLVYSFADATAIAKAKHVGLARYQ
jgi:hypothetical protein